MAPSGSAMHYTAIEGVHEVLDGDWLGVRHIDMLGWVVQPIEKYYVLFLGAQCEVLPALRVTVVVEAGSLVIVVVPIHHGHLDSLGGQPRIALQIGRVSQIDDLVIVEALILLNFLAIDLGVPVARELANDQSHAD